MKTHDKKWAIQQMLDGKKVLQGESTILRYCYGEFYQVAGDCMGAVEINSLPKGGYTLYEEPEKVELLEEAIMVMENKIGTISSRGLEYVRRKDFDSNIDSLAETCSGLLKRIENLEKLTED